MKKYLFGLFTGLFISSSVVFAANYLYHADEVSYDPKDINWNVTDVDSAIKELYNKISDANSALLNLKNTDIAKAVGADGDTFSSVINRLGSITNQGDKSFTLSDTNSITIPAGYYNGQGTITTLGLIPTPTSTKTITSNGNNIDVTNFAKVNVNIAPSTIISGGQVVANGRTSSFNAKVGDYYVIFALANDQWTVSGATKIASIGASNVNYVYMTLVKATSTTVSFSNAYGGGAIHIV